MFSVKKQITEHSFYNLLQEKNLILFYQPTPTPLEEWQAVKKQISVENQKSEWEGGNGVSTPAKLGPVPLPVGLSPGQEKQLVGRPVGFSPGQREESSPNKTSPPSKKIKRKLMKGEFPTLEKWFSKIKNKVEDDQSDPLTPSSFNSRKRSILLVKGKVVRRVFDKQPLPDQSGERSADRKRVFNSQLLFFSPPKQVGTSGGLGKSAPPPYSTSRYQPGTLPSKAGSTLLKLFPLQGNTFWLGVDSLQQLAVAASLLKKTDNLFLLGGLSFGQAISHLDIERLITLDKPIYPAFMTGLRGALLPFLVGKNHQSGDFLPSKGSFSLKGKLILSFNLIPLKLKLAAL